MIRWPSRLPDFSMMLWPRLGMHRSPFGMDRSFLNFKLHASQFKAPASQNSFLHASLLFRCIVPENQLHKKDGTRPC